MPRNNGSSGGPATVITRRQQPVQFTANAKQVIPLVRGLCYREMFLELTGQLTLAGASNTVAATLLGDEWALITKIELIVNGTTTLFSMSGSDLRPVNRILKGGLSPRVTVALGDGATANPAFDSTVVIPFLNPRSVRPFDTLLYTGEMSDARLEVTWGTFTSVNAAATNFTVTPVLNVWTREQTLPTDANGAPMLPNFYRRTQKIPVLIAGASSAFRYQLPTGPIYRGIVMNALNGGLAETNGLFSNVRVFSGPTTYIDVAETVLYETGNWKGRIPYEQWDQSTGIYFQGKGDISSVRNMRSWYWLDFADDGYMSESIDTDSVGDTFLEFNTSAAATINLITQELIRIQRGGTGNVTTGG